MKSVNLFEDEAICDERSEAFLQYRVNGTDAIPGNIDELLEDTGDLILD